MLIFIILLTIAMLIGAQSINLNVITPQEDMEPEDYDTGARLGCLAIAMISGLGVFFFLVGGSAGLK